MIFRVLIATWIVLAALACDRPDAADTTPMSDDVSLVSEDQATPTQSMEAFTPVPDPTLPAAPEPAPPETVKQITPTRPTVIANTPLPTVDTPQSCDVLCDEEFWEDAHIDHVRAVLDSGIDLTVSDDYGNHPLIYAMSFAKDVEIVRLLLEHGADPNQADQYSGRTPLHHLANDAGYAYSPQMIELVPGGSEVYLTTRLDLMNLLLDHGADSTVRDEYGQSVLFIYVANAIESDALVLDQRVVKLMLENGVTIKKDSDSDRQIMALAFWAGADPGVVQLLIEHGSDAAGLNDDEFSVLHSAIWYGAPLRTIEILLDHGQEATATGPKGWTALHAAARSSRLDPQVALVLLNAGADANALNDQGQTPIHHAASFSNGEFVSALLDHGADASARDARNRTPLHIMSRDPAYRNGEVDSDVFNLLLKNGADVNARDDIGKTPLHYAAWQEHTDNARLLLEHGADATIPGEFNETPLHAASATGVLEMVKLLLQHGADVKAVDDDHQTPLHWSADRLTSAMVVAVLLDHGADANSVDVDGNTPLHMAAKAREHWPEPRNDILGMLLDAGADLSAVNNGGETACDVIDDDETRDLLCRN